jgi:hypothetical protein
MSRNFRRPFFFTLWVMPFGSPSVRLVKPGARNNRECAVAGLKKVQVSTVFALATRPGWMKKRAIN